jgi:hypothetical protein
VISNPEIFQKFVVCKDSSKPKSADKALLYSKQWVYFADLDSNPVFTISSVNVRLSKEEKRFLSKVIRHVFQFLVLIRLYWAYKINTIFSSPLI